jgi:hypothetical protein
MSTEQKLNSKLFATPYIEFLNHLGIEDNYRVLFSGRYGIGKTTFLNWFFEQKEVTDKYCKIHLYPVNYSVASNEDIFKYIKMDILIYLLENTDVHIEHYNFNSLEVLPTFIQSHLFEFFTASITLFAAMKGDAKVTGAITAKIDQLKSKFTDHKIAINEKASDLKTVERFMLDLVNKEGSIYEFNFISELITQLLAQWKDQNNGKEIILVIDDLDRIDPHHIFRLLNIFAAHYDHPSNRDEKHNKFGFDKVVMVADSNNIRNIFHTQYGSKSDFSGYIDKFYSNSIFYYNNINDIRDVVKGIIEGKLFIFNELGQRTMPLSYILKSNYIEDINFFLISFLLIGKINFRNLNKTKTIIQNKTINGQNRTANWMSYFILKIECLKDIVGDIDQLLLCLEEAESKIGKDTIYDKYNYALAEALPIFGDFDRINQEQNVFVGGKQIYYSNKMHGQVVIAEDIHVNGSTTYNEMNSNMPSIFELYYEGVKRLRQLGYFTS